MSVDGSLISDATRRQLLDGGEFIIDPPKHVAAIWGKAQDVAWQQGESLLLVGPTGVGKGGVLQQVALRRMGILTGDLLGYPVQADPERLTVYLAMDRPAQITRSFKRMVLDDHRAPLRERLRVWKGALPFDLVKHPEQLAEFVLEIGALAGRPVGSVFVDSIKDLASKLSTDETGGAINRAFSLVLAADIELAASHHQRKATAENKKPTKVDDVFGSTWITAGAGSVILLWGEPGDTTIELSHLKPAAEPLGPFEIEHDHDHGITTRPERADPWSVLQAATNGGVTVADATNAIYGTKHEKKHTVAVRRKLDRYVKEQYAVKTEPSEKFTEARYRPTPSQLTVDASANGRSGGVPRLRSQGTAENTRSQTPASIGNTPRTPPVTPSPYVVGGGVRSREDEYDDDIDTLPATTHGAVR
ncbi:MAG TPA: AAA family ATPase [Solirubrobacteraceae bacterium]|nr:AAA family ATPase [Solirubrobacteraceae bacterium]